jgi:hypothetical protein
VERGDSVQASEKFYKCGEEAIKFLAEYYELPEYKEAKENGRWDARLLFDAVKKLSEKVDINIVNYWQSAWFLHVEGFHEMRLNLEQVKFRLPHIEKLVDIVCNLE